MGIVYKSVGSKYSVLYEPDRYELSKWAVTDWSMAETVCRFTCKRVNVVEWNEASTRQIS